MSLTLDSIINSATQQNTNCSENISSKSNNDYSDKISQVFQLFLHQELIRQQKAQYVHNKFLIRAGGSAILGLMNIPAGVFAFFGSMLSDCVCPEKPSQYPSVLLKFHDFWKTKPHLDGPSALNQFLKNIQKNINITIYDPTNKNIQEHMKKNPSIGYWQTKLNLVAQYYFKQLDEKDHRKKQEDQCGDLPWI